MIAKRFVCSGLYMSFSAHTQQNSADFCALRPTRARYLKCRQIVLTCVCLAQILTAGHCSWLIHWYMYNLVTCTEQVSAAATCWFSALESSVQEVVKKAYSSLFSAFQPEGTQWPTAVRSKSSNLSFTFQLAISSAKIVPRNTVLLQP